MEDPKVRRSIPGKGNVSATGRNLRYAVAGGKVSCVASEPSGRIFQTPTRSRPARVVRRHGTAWRDLNSQPKRLSKSFQREKANRQSCRIPPARFLTRDAFRS